MSALRIATVPYLNIEPFLFAMRELARPDLPFSIERLRPSNLDARYRCGDIDLCMLSSSDLLRLRVTPLRGASISCRGPVASVVLASRSAPSTWSRRPITVGLDAASSTSNDLARVVLDRVFRSHASFRRVRDPVFQVSSGACDVAVVIGDAALRLPRELVALDLAEVWHGWTSLPFVFAAWARGPGSFWHAADLEDLLEHAARVSLRHVEQSVRERRLPITDEVARAYLERNISYRFGPSERVGLERFAQLAGLPAVTRPGRRHAAISTAGLTGFAESGGER